MSTITDPGAAAPAGEAARAAPSRLYRAVWRWHFYAGLFSLPFLFLLAFTGGTYLLKDEISDLLHPELRFVEARETAPLQPSALIASALESAPGDAYAYSPAPAPDRSAVVKIKTDEGKQAVHLDPYDGRVLGVMPDAKMSGSPAMQWIRDLHSLKHFGWVATRMIELVAGWTLVLVATGFYLWWPRGRQGGVFAIRAGKGRTFWKDLHAVTGLYAGAAIFFLALTGLPWSDFWGRHFYDTVDSLGIGMPPGYWSGYPESDAKLAETIDQTPWVAQQAPMPQSQPSTLPPQPVDAAVATVESLGIAPGYALNLPSGPTGVFTASVYPDDISRERVIHIDQHSGKVLFDMGFADLGAFGRAAEWGVSVHMGQRYGIANQLILLSVCVALMVMCVGAGVMWWKRRPQGKLGAPRAPRDWRAPGVILAIACAFGALFPLVGLSMLVMLALDLALPKGLRERLG